ncbi:UDP-N-acetylglucosamine--N-acetylmuramyl-(pentapeptide) pyrophosphoryl-undecaprenol N-acetylglucosamine transferase [Arcanobacterium pinnipediorum]|uniref:UDP-N-acetylglucosamine--N-acetylmuramyl-(pentapeptide) pyrophosphoryl-undecaprenol N-acetylglucosamine transferase n=1 Tax=Arcanobacterium pinnipediorum TaxID=1503041 RepID=A0ABY5AJ81_9ACTO|nr:UDP-N-acetylglucosamine--N-acetylmuramyl-(pentapeptide) pyrophosphoryl-undecaprenol N-acetylglucosamine transferase [Arcanobacterium pinnipediorum]USR80031.1 UDP-N-acetylglucosamine--N-acetylmuramyl-(pentapeptide) pyrophosphoryl-undecaprenol N-acetylglucosamine transferase [Arcanobacterium pinnipediorum]
MVLSVVLCGGGTAGHVNPLIASAQAIRSLVPEARITAVGTASGLENELVPAAGFDLALVERAPFPRRLNRQALKFPARFMRAVKQSRKILRDAQASCVIGFGGYASTPIYWAARREGIPIIVHEANAVPGMANKLGARYARVVALTFPSTPLQAKNGITVTVGLPLRPAIAQLANSDPAERQHRRESAARRFGLDPLRSIVVVSGGSLGAVKLNETMQEAGPNLRAQILHITGKDKDGDVRRAVGENRDYVVVDYVTDMEEVYALADVLIARSGAGMVSEAATLGIPTVFVPLPIGNGEQARNAHDVVEAGGGILVDNSDFTPQWVAENLPALLDPERQALMSAQGRRVAPSDAATKLAQYAIESAGES